MSPTPPADAAGQSLEALREILAERGLDGWYVGREDMFQGEEVPASEERLAFISGFTGSAGFGLILADDAALFSDGRYTLQMANQTDSAFWRTFTLPEADLGGFLAEKQLTGARIGVDPRLVTVRGFDRLAGRCRAAGAVLVADAANPVDAVWGRDRPDAAPSRPFAMPDRVAGQGMAIPCPATRSGIAKGRDGAASGRSRPQTASTGLAASATSTAPAARHRPASRSKPRTVTSRGSTPIRAPVSCFSARKPPRSASGSVKVRQNAESVWLAICSV